MPSPDLRDRTSAEKRIWFALRDLKRVNSLTPAYLDLNDRGFEVFTPMKEVVVTRQGRRQRISRPVVQDLLFVHALRSELDPVVEMVPTLQYRFSKGMGYRQPMVVPDRQMDAFIKAVTNAEAPRFYRPEEITPAMAGCRARILGGPFDGIECRLMRIRGARTRRILVEVTGLMAVSVEVNPEYVQILPEPDKTTDNQ